MVALRAPRSRAPRVSLVRRVSHRRKDVSARNAPALPRGSARDRALWSRCALRGPELPESRSFVAFRTDGKTCRRETLLHSREVPLVTRPVDELADGYVAECVERYPEVATSLGASGHDHEWSDYSPVGVAAELDHLRTTVAALAGAIPSDEREQIAKEAMLERLALEVELHEAHIPASRVSSVAGAVQGLVNTIDLMPDGTAEAWTAIIERVRTMDRPLGQIIETLRAE